ncbi:hypothetical protein TMatcc_010118 [Talaromyces marneffei ATCC 18224]|uniref:Asl1-like glycosyl hydrolase catalytic domain-containing protein n=1 Tax=Talaromyces marneffei (strain ATCC 18224 / CBS 334.59 / QM 7333) TaxID=441960 RepID=B6QU14_TALMQ|nr:uncharacterized protein EYB26_009319 [Talaromyces marneffei]EEA19974.1 conserved hypothetical protein [Talaromyces marneffei ATCC 18224]KAE8548263.1 hypothetical protein EYB25_010057 [Talaromyces marneffei]QGA21608.1 hypothetical protein EYB26_009319 [Talaromyces marneffei]
MTSLLSTTAAFLVTASIAAAAANGTGKRGLVYNNNNVYGDATYANDFFAISSQVTWAYDWGYPSHNLSLVFEFVPMLWGLPSGDAPDWTDAVQMAGTVNILGFNEPDLTYSGSSNLLPAAAAQRYITYMERLRSTVRIGVPNVLWNNYDSTSSGGDYSSRVWTSYFMGNCTDCHFDFACIHWYQDCEPGNSESGADWFTSNVTDAYNTLQLPLWITEFQCYGNDDQQVSFLQSVMPWLDTQDYVERYAYFGVFPDYLLDDAGDALSAAGHAYISS